VEISSLWRWRRKLRRCKKKSLSICWGKR